MNIRKDKLYEIESCFYEFTIHMCNVLFRSKPWYNYEENKNKWKAQQVLHPSKTCQYNPSVGPHPNKTTNLAASRQNCLRGFQPDPKHNGLYSHRKWL